MKCKRKNPVFECSNNIIINKYKSKFSSKTESFLLKVHHYFPCCNKNSTKNEIKRTNVANLDMQYNSYMILGNKGESSKLMFLKA